MLCRVLNPPLMVSNNESGLKSISKVETNHMTLVNQLSSNRSTKSYENEFHQISFPVNRKTRDNTILTHASMERNFISTGMQQEMNFFERYSLPSNHKRFVIFNLFS